jgi:DNA-binding IclR family transcriptional regulator
MALGEKGYSIAAAEKVLRVEDWLAGGEILEWRTVREVAEANGLSLNQAHRCLHTLVKCGRAEQSDKGSFRAGQGIVKYGLRLNECLSGHVKRFT